MDAKFRQITCKRSLSGNEFDKGIQDKSLS
jgi:hypothetical protein